MKPKSQKKDKNPFGVPRYIIKTMDYHQLKFSVEWQMQRYSLTEEEAIKKIADMKKSFGTSRVYSVEWQMNKWNISEEEATKRIEKSKDKTRNTQKQMSDFDFKAMCSKNPEHWIKKGFNKDEAKKIAKEQVEYMQSCYQKEKKENPEKYNDRGTNQIKYWLKLGYSEEEAKEKVKERQATGKLERFIERYGEEEGRKRWEERQIKWQNTLNNKSPEEKKRINKLKSGTIENFIRKYGIIDGTIKYHEKNAKSGVTLENYIKKYGEKEGTIKYDTWYNKHIKNLSNISFYSRISQELFYKLLENISIKEDVKFATHNGEKIIKAKSKCYMYDFCYNDKIIEFNGDIFHANPAIFKENDRPNPFCKHLISKEIWEHDKNKNNIAINKNYKLLIIWEKDYRENKEKIVNECLNFLNL